MTSILSTLRNTKDWYRHPNTEGRMTSLTSLGKGWNYIPLIDESWTKPSGGIDTYDNGGDGLSIGTPATPGFYFLADYWRKAAGGDVYVTWKTIDVRDFSEFYVWCENVYPGVDNYLRFGPIYAIEDSHDAFESVFSHHYMSSIRTYYQCREDESPSQYLNGVIGSSGYLTDIYQNYTSFNYNRSSEYPDSRPFKCLGRYMKLQFLCFNLASPRVAPQNLESIDKLGVLIR